jgi:hypothetical protein
MKFVLLLSVCIAAVVVQAMPYESDVQFVKFQQQFGRKYTSEFERAYRFTVFNDNLVFIRAHNARAATGEYSFTLGVTPFADMTNEEYKKMLTLKSKKGAK